MQNILFSLALRNIFRQKIRTIATLAAIAIGVSGLILAGGFVKDIFIQLGEAIIHSQTGHIQITRTGYNDNKTRAPEKFLIKEGDELRAKLVSQIPEIDQVISRLGFTGVINNGHRDLGIVGEGIEPDGEAKLGTFLNYLEGRALTSADHDGIVVGDGVAKSLGLKIGDRVTIVMTLAAGAVNTLDFELVGIFQSFSKEFDARAVRIPLDAAKTLMDSRGIHFLVIQLKDTASTRAVSMSTKQLLANQGFDVTPWYTLSDFYEKTVDLYDRQFGVLRLIILIMVLLSVINSINMTLFERTREFGTMRALGDRSDWVFRLIMIENIWLGLIGGLLGIILGCLAALGISAIGIPMPPPPNANLGYTALIRLDSTSVLTAGAVGFIASMLAAIIPARRAAKADIVEALRHGV